MNPHDEAILAYLRDRRVRFTADEIRYQLAKRGHRLNPVQIQVHLAGLVAAGLVARVGGDTYQAARVQEAV